MFPAELVPVKSAGFELRSQLIRLGLTAPPRRRNDLLFAHPSTEPPKARRVQGGVGLTDTV